MRDGEDDWKLEGNCRGADVDLFFPVPRGDGFAPDYRPALEICRGCPVLLPCREFGKDEKQGVYGGLTPYDRGMAPRRIRPRHPAVCEVCGIEFTAAQKRVMLCRPCYARLWRQRQGEAS